MNALPALRPTLSVDAYLAGEEGANCRHDYLAGEVYAMSGASARHNIICGNLFSALHRHLRGGPCQVFMADLKVRIAYDGDTYFYYPDIMVGRRPDDRATHYREHPQVLIEVISESTERVDRREKNFLYRQISDLREYLVIEQRQAAVIVNHRHTGPWQNQAFGPEDTLVIPSLDFSLPISELYLGVDFTEQ